MSVLQVYTQRFDPNLTFNFEVKSADVKPIFRRDCSAAAYDIIDDDWVWQGRDKRPRGRRLRSAGAFVCSRQCVFVCVLWVSSPLHSPKIISSGARKYREVQSREGGGFKLIMVT